MSLILGYATPTNAIIMSDGRAIRVEEEVPYSENCDKTLKINDNIIMGFAGIMENIDMFLSCILSNMGDDRKYYLIDDFLDMVNYVMQDEETKSLLQSDFVIIGRNDKKEMFTCTVGMSTNYIIEKNAATSPRYLCIGGTIDGTIIQNTYFKNMRFKDFDVEKCMSNTIKEISQIDPSINSNTFFHTI